MFRSKLNGSEIINANDKFFELLGLTREEVLGKPFLARYANPAQRDSILCTVNDKGHIVDAEVQFIHKNGEIRDCLALSRDTKLKQIDENNFAEVHYVNERGRVTRTFEQNKYDLVKWTWPYPGKMVWTL